MAERGKETGFNAATPAGSMHSHRSWGRTRRPKALYADKIGTAVTLPTAAAVTLVAATTSLNDTLEDTALSENGYVTENQRYLHLLVENGTADDETAGLRTVTVYGYNYALRKWAALVDTNNVPVVLTAPDADGAQTVAGRKMQTFEIAGVDRIAFVGVAADVKCFAACSTF